MACFDGLLLVGLSQLHSLLYPLAIANVTTAAINLAASIGAPQVTAEIIKEV